MATVPRDDYYAIMWNFYDPMYLTPDRARQAIRRYREVTSCNAGTLMATFVNLDTYKKSLEVFGLPLGNFKMENWGDYPFKENGFPFYVMNCVRPFYWNWNEAKPLFRKQYEEFHRTRERKVFTRTDCVNNPKVMDAIKSRLADVVNGLKGARDLTLLYDLRDEPSITSFLLPSDLCFCDHCIARLRDSLRAKYGDLAGLNAAWATAFATWEDVVPMTTEEALERRAAGKWNFAPWADHRLFMNETFARAVRECADELRRLHPGALAGLCGTQTPSVFGGYDFYKLTTALDWIEAYDFGNSVDCIRSFKPSRAYPILKTTGLGGGHEARRAMLWQFVYQSGGYSGTILWSSNDMFEAASKNITPKKGTRELGVALAELRCGAPRLLQASDEVSSPVAIHYSQSSILADFITSVPNRWRSVAGWYDEKGGVYKARTAWMSILEDRGYRPRLLATEQIESGALRDGGVRLLVLPRSISLTDAEAAEMRKFVEAGGTLVADSFVGRMDEHCRERSVGVLDDLLGIRRIEHDNYHSSDEQINVYKLTDGTKLPGRAILTGARYIEELIEPAADALVLGATELTDSKVGILVKRGKGLAFLCNATPVNYDSQRKSPSGGFQRLFGAAVDTAGVEPLFTLTAKGQKAPMPGWRLFAFSHGDNRYYAASPDMGVTQDVLGAIEVGAERRGGGKVGVVARFPAGGHIYDVLAGRYLGRGKSAAVKLGAFDAPLFAVMKTKAKSMALAFDGENASAKLSVSGGTPGERVFRFDLLDAKGKRLIDCGANVVAADGAAEWTPDSTLPKRGKIVCRDVATGVQATVRVK